MTNAPDRPLALLFRVDGLPVPQGWIRAFQARGRVVYAHGSPGLAKWRKAISAQAKRAMGDDPPTMAAVKVALTFAMPRPRDHTGAHGLKPWAIGAQVSKRPDLDRLIRAVLDAITGTVLLDDAQVVYLVAAKVYADPNQDRPVGVTVFVADMEPDSTPLPTNQVLEFA